jgi:hypothetical protein
MVAHEDWMLSHIRKVITIRNNGEMTKLAFFRAFIIIFSVDSKSLNFCLLTELLFHEKDLWQAQ